VLVAVRYAGQVFLSDLHTGRPLTQSDYTRSPPEDEHRVSGNM